MARPPEPIFLERQSYRRRRLGDAAKLLPVLGMILMILPVLWSDTGRTAGGIVYIFTIWAMLIAIVAFLSRLLRGTDPGTEDPSGAKSEDR